MTETPEAFADEQRPDELTPLSVLVDELTDILRTLDGVTECTVMHRRAARDDRRSLDGLNYIDGRVNLAYTALLGARKALTQL